MALTITNDLELGGVAKATHVGRATYMHTGTITFDNSYAGASITAKGGEDFSTVHNRFTNTFKVLITPRSGAAQNYTYQYDYTNKKVRAFTTAPALVYEEVATAVANVATLRYPAAWIINVCTTGQNEALRASTATLSDSQCNYGSAPADGILTTVDSFGATDALLVTYATQAWKDLYDLLVFEEAVTLAAGDNNLENNMAAFGYCEAASGITVPVDVADTTASGEIGIKFNAATAQLNSHADENGAAVCTYLKTPTAGTWLADHWVYDEDPAKAGSDPYTQAFDYPLCMWGISGALTVNSGTTQVIVDQGITADTGEVNTRWGMSNYELLATVGVAPVAGHVWGAKSDVTVTAGNYIKGHPWEIPDLAPLEVPEGTDLSSVVCDYVAFGRTRN